MSKLTRLLAVITLLALIPGSFSAPLVQASPAFQAFPEREWTSKVDPWVLETASSGETEFLVFLSQQADLSGAVRLSTKLEKGTYVYQHLTEVAQRTQKPILQALNSRGVTYRPYWVANAIWVRGDQGTIQALAQRPDVAHLYANPAVHLQMPEQPQTPPDSSLLPESTDTVEWNIEKVGAPSLWAAGYTGQGAVIGGQDTGYDWTHPALKSHYRGWNDGTVNHNYNWHDAIHQNDPNTAAGNPCGFDAQAPCDDLGHGTHTMGTMVGDDGAGNQIGMAPGARWIGCRNMEQGWGKPSTYMECYQWFIAPTDLNDQNPRPDLAPDVINNSWSCPPKEGCDDPNVLLEVVNNVRAAGIVTVHSAGNDGNSCASIDTPAAIYAASFTVGATNASDNIASFSSRGPVTVDGSGRLKPDISAPGVYIRSSLPGDKYGYMDGTSMAGPHVAGLVALLISAHPNLAGQVDKLQNLIEQSAVHLTTARTCGGVSGFSIPNNTYGWGRIDAWRAYLGSLDHLALVKTASSRYIEPGELLTYTLTTTNTNLIAPATNLIISDTLPASTTFITATLPHAFDGTTVRWDFASLGTNASHSVNLVVQAPSIPFGKVVNDRYTVTSDEVTSPVTSTAVTTYIGKPLYMPLVRVLSKP